MESNSEAPQSRDRIPLFSNSKVDVFIPKKPNVPIEEGLQVQVEPSNSEKKDSPKNILLRYLYSVAAAKVIAEGSQTPQEAWANTRIDENNEVNAFGRNALNPDSWRKPVDAHDRETSFMKKLPEPYNQEKLQRLFGSYVRKWDQVTEQIELFSGGIVQLPIDREKDNPQGDVTVWESDQYVAKIISSPHLKGTHIVVDAKFPPGGEFPRQWMTRLKKGEPLDEKYVKMTLESTAIALGIRDLLGRGRGEIHNSGNWAGGLKDVSEGGVIDTEALKENAKKEKRKHRVTEEEKVQEKYGVLFDVLERRANGEEVPDNEIEEAMRKINSKSFGTFMHVHVYIPESGRVVLPIMSEGEATERESKTGEGEKTKYRKIIDQWKSIPRTTQEQTDRVRERLGNNKLSDWVNKNCAGKLAS